MKSTDLLNGDRASGNTLAEHVQDWQALIDSLPYPVCVVDTAFNIIMSNRAMADFFDGAGDIKDSKCYETFHHSDRPAENCPMQKTLKTGKSERTRIYEPCLKKSFFLNTSPIIIKGNISGAVHSITDVGEGETAGEDGGGLIEIYSNTIADLQNRALYAQRGRDAFLNMLEDISESYKELKDLFLKLVRVMVNALDAKSPWTKGHSERVSMYAEQIAMEMLIDGEEVKNIKLAGLLHDIGKIGTYDYLLDKPGKLTKEEFEIVKKHPVQGALILQEIKQLKDIIPYIRFHHEKLDGSGYPDRLKGDSIPLSARILHVADSFDSMTSDRPYRPAPGIDYALSELQKYKGIQFDHRVVDAFLRVLAARRR